MNSIVEPCGKILKGGIMIVIIEGRIQHAHMYNSDFPHT